MSEARVRDALAQIGAEMDVAPDLFERSQRRVGIRRRKRTTRVVLAAAACVAVAIGAVSVVVRDDDTSPIVADEPPAPIPDEVVAVVDGSVVVLSTGDLALQRTIWENDSRDFPTEVSASTDGVVVAFTRRGASDASCTTDARDLVGPNDRVLTSSGPLFPLVSPDGGFVAYRWSECDSQPHVGISSFDGGNYLVSSSSNDSDAVRPLAWTLDSRGVLVTFGAGYAVIDAPRGDSRRGVELPDGTYRAAFIADDEVAIAYPEREAHIVAIATLDGEVVRELIRIPSAASSLSFDLESRTLLVGGEGSLRVVPLDGPPTTMKIPGVTAGVWLRARPAAEPDTVVLPDVLGLQPEDATQVLEELGFNVAIEDTGTGSLVVEMSSRPGTPVAVGSTITLVVGAFEREPVTVPDLRGLSGRQAEQALGEAGLSSSMIGVAVDEPADGSVFWQEPPPETRRMTGDEVTFWVCHPTARCVTPPEHYVDSWHAATAWRPLDLAAEPLSSIAAGSYAEPAELGEALADDLRDGFELYETVRVAYTGDVWVQLRGLPDDSSDGLDFRLDVEQAPGGWRLAGGELRSICYRGGNGAELCL